MKELMIFKGVELEILTKDDISLDFHGDVLFNGKQIAGILEYADASSTISKNVRDIHKYKVKNSDLLNWQFRKLNNAGETFITEKGVMKLIISSNMPKADEFEDLVWNIVTEVQKTGRYDVVEQRLQQIEDLKERELTLTLHQLENTLKINPNDMMMILTYNTKKQELSNYINEKNIKEIASVVNTVDTKLKKLTVANEGDMTASAVAKKLNIFSTSNKPHNKFAENVARELGFYINPKDNLGYSDDYVNIRLSQVGGVELPTLMYTRKAFDEIEEYANNDMVIEQPAKYFVKGIKKGEFNFALIKFNNNDGIKINQTTYDLYTNQD